MLTDQDIKNLTNYQLEVFKDVFVIKDEFNDKIDGIDGKLDKLQITVDKIVKDVKIVKDDNVVLNSRMKNVENWVDKASPKLGLEFKH